MAIPTYTPIATQTLNSSAASITFTSIPQTYTDLVIVGNYYVTFPSNRLSAIQVGNGSIDTGNNYSSTYFGGNGSSAFTGRDSNTSAIYGPNHFGSYATGILNIQNYSNTSTNKTILTKGGTATGNTGASIGLWRNTAAINQIRWLPNGDEFGSGSTFTLYGISNAGDDSPKANGGSVYSDSTYWYHAFTSSGNFVPNQSFSADVLCIAGGGGGGGSAGTGASGGGGGAGGIIYFASQSLTAQNYPVFIGGGGAKGVGTSRGVSGGNSGFASLTVATGGGGGGTQGGSAGGISGGSGGGGTYQSAGGGSSTQSGSGATSFYGNSGGGGSSGVGAGGGGGGAGASGTSAAGGGPAGNGGNGITAFSSWGLATLTGQNISGTVWYGGGGAGGWNTGVVGTAGNGGGGLGTETQVDGLINSGGGGGGAGYGSSNGGSGLVIVRYLK
jgi:hypothetical protein